MTNSFLESLFEAGEIEIAASPSESRDTRTIEATIRRYELIWRMQQPLEPPAFDVAQALIAAKILESACRAVVYRHIELEQFEQSIHGTGLHLNDDPCLHYSVDLLFCFLPQVAERAARVSESDPLLNALRTLGRQWPLSSVGMPGCEPASVPHAFEHPSLWRMYIDRIISRKDKSRLNIPLVRDAVAATIGPFPHLAPHFASEFSSLG